MAIQKNESEAIAIAYCYIFIILLSKYLKLSNTCPLVLLVKLRTTVIMSITPMDGNSIEYETITSSLVDRSGRGAIPH